MGSEGRCASGAVNNVTRLHDHTPLTADRRRDDAFRALGEVSTQTCMRRSVEARA
jgi:hypothetical protein